MTKVMKNWKDIWNDKKIITENNGYDEFDRFCELKRINGFDVAIGNEELYYRAFYEEWLDFYKEVTKRIGISFSSVFEVGCGSGVNLFMFRNRGVINLGGVDYSYSMVESARTVIESNDLKCCDANEIDDFPKYDLVMSESVFQYFDSIGYAEKVLRKMIEKSKKLVYLGEIHDVRYEEELIMERRKKIEDYDNKYKGLRKQFYSKVWIEAIADDYGRKVEYTTVNNSEYLNWKYLFNCYIY